MKYLKLLLIIITLFHFQSCYVYIPKGYDVIIPFEHNKNYDCQMYEGVENIIPSKDSIKLCEFYLKQQQTMEARMNLLMQYSKGHHQFITWNDLNSIREGNSKAYYHNKKYGYVKLISSIDFSLPKLSPVELRYSIPSSTYYPVFYVDENLEIASSINDLRRERVNYPGLGIVKTPLGNFKFYVNMGASFPNAYEIYAIRINNIKYHSADIVHSLERYKKENMEYRIPIDDVDVLCLTDGSFSYNTSKAVLYALYIQNMPVEYKRKKDYKIKFDTLYRYSTLGNKRWFKPRNNSNCGCLGADFQFKVWQSFIMKKIPSTKEIFAERSIRVHYPPYTGFFNRRMYYPYRGNPEYLNSFIYLMSWSKYAPEDVFFEKKHFYQFYYTFKSQRDEKNYRLHYNARNGKFVKYKEITK